MTPEQQHNLIINLNRHIFDLFNDINKRSLLSGEQYDSELKIQELVNNEVETYIKQSKFYTPETKPILDKVEVKVTEDRFPGYPCSTLIFEYNKYGKILGEGSATFQPPKKETPENTPKQNDIDISKRYRTKDGRAVRILATDIKSTHYPVVAAVTERDGTESIRKYSLSGREKVHQSRLVECKSLTDYKLDDIIYVVISGVGERFPYYFAGICKETNKPLVFPLHMSSVIYDFMRKRINLPNPIKADDWSDIPNDTNHLKNT